MNTALTPLLSDSFSLKDRVVVITGPQGETARQWALAVLEAEGRVIMADRNLDQVQARSAELMDPAVSVAYLDPMRRDSCREFLATTIAKYGRLDVVINGPDETLGPVGPSDPAILEDWQAELALGMRGALSVSLVLGAYMAQTGGGAIVNVGASKAEGSLVGVETMILMTRYLANYFRDDGVRVNALFEGPCDAGIGARFVQPLHQLAFLSRIVRHEETRAALVFLASDASRQMNGQTLVSDATIERRPRNQSGLEWLQSPFQDLALTS